MKSARALATLSLGSLLVFSGPIATARLSAAPPPDSAADNDHDGIPDTLEQRLAERWAPMIYIEPDESNYPVNAEWILARGRLQYHEDCTFDVDSDVGPVPIGPQLLGLNDSSLWAAGPNCGQDDTGYSHPPHRVLTTVAADPDGQFSAGADTTGYSDQQTFAILDLPDEDHVGSTDPHQWTTYFHAYPASDGGVMIQYWHVFAYNEFGGGFDNHGGDWDASIQVHLNPDLTIKGVWFSRHADDHPGTFFAPQDVRFFDSTHPVVTIDGGGHASFRSPYDWATCNCRVGESVTGPIGTVVWTNDGDAYDDPAALREVDLVCVDALCTIQLSSPSGGIVWETWTGGGVAATGSLTNSILAPSPHGGLVNLGEYNPCTLASPTTCLGSSQASLLLAGESHPLNGAFWLRYSGRWGSVGEINSGPRGPVFQGFEDRGESHDSVYRAWYNEGANAAASSDGTYPWLVPPTTAVGVQPPPFLANGSSFVAPTTQVSLSATQSAAAAPYGSVQTYSRSYPSGGSASYAPYAGPFGVGPADGAYTIDWFSVDGLGNVETAQSLALTLDGTAPSATIAAPASTTYPHSASLTLQYAASDGSGSGVSSVQATLDGAATLPDGTPLSSGQTIDLLTQLPLGTHTFTVNAADHVGNAGSSSATFSIVVTPESLEDDVRQLTAAGKIAPNGASLLRQLDAAARARDCGTAARIYAAFIQHVTAQAGKSIDAAAAQILIGDAQYLIARCP